MKKTPEEVQSDNLKHFMEHGPGLSYAYGTFVVARDKERGKVLIGGLGGMGVGQMWVDETPAHKDYPGYEDAEEFRCEA